MQTTPLQSPSTAPAAAPVVADPLAARIRLARAALAWEQLWVALWPAVALVGLFAVFALFDVLPMLPTWLHALILAGFVAGIGWSVWRARTVFALPAQEAGRRRLEVASGMLHRPLFALRDELAGGADDPIARSLWDAHRARMRAALKSVRVGWPSPGLPAKDPLALRAALVLLLIVGVTASGSDIGERFARAFVPGSGIPPVPPGALDLWITPPAYTGLAPLLPRSAANEPPANEEPATSGPPQPLAIPAGSTLLAQVTGGEGTPHLIIDKKDAAFTPIDKDANDTSAPAWRAGTTLNEGAELVIKQGRMTLGAWPLKIVADQPPTIEFSKKPSVSERGALRLEYKAHDDYGLASVKAAIRRAGEVPEGAPGQPINIPLTLPKQNAKDATGSTYQDLTAHPWAGLPVVIQLHATDAAGHSGVSEDVSMTLPERSFQNPVARAIVAQRKVLVADPTGARPLVGHALSAIAGVPHQYNDDSVVFLALTTAAQRLGRDPSPAGTDAVQSLLWDTALRVEDGRLSVSERDLRALQQKLQDALARNAPDDEIQRLMNQLQQAINRYLQAMMENARQHPEQMQPLNPNARTLNSLDLQKMLDRARELARTGARDAARQMLSQLQDMLENLRAGRPMMGQQQGGGSQGQQMMQSLQQLMQRQQNLLDKTFRQSQQGRPGMPGMRGMPGMPGQPGMRGQQGQGQQGEPSEDTGDGASAGEQEALRRQLGDMMRKFGEQMGNIPDGLGRAERSMRDSGQALQEGAPGRAVRPQMQALDQMRSAARDLAQQMAEQNGQGEGAGDAYGDNAPDQPNRDPAGRPLNGLGGLDGRDVTIPENADIQRSREILDELLRRAGERFRPQIERDYIDRLLKRF